MTITGRYLRWAGRRKLQRQELTWLLVGLGACVLLFVFILFAGEVMEGDTQALDLRILRALRKADDPSKPIGPEWIELALSDLTALGGPTVLGLVTFAVMGFLVLQARYRTALVILITASSGELVMPPPPRRAGPAAPRSAQASAGRPRGETGRGRR